jgi:hypothetical protein
MHVHLRRVRQAVRRKQPIHQELQPIRLFHDDLRVLVQSRTLELAVEQLRRTAYATERILDLVREIADQLAIRFALVEHALLARDLELLIRVAEFEEIAAAGEF